MGANGSFSGGLYRDENLLRWETVKVLNNGVKIIEFKNKKTALKMPEESHSPNTTYAMMNKNGEGIKSIARYGSDGKKLFEIHTAKHHGLDTHFHYWKDGKPLDPISIDSSPNKKKLLDDVMKNL